MHHLVGNADEAEDLAQEVFLRVYRARKKYRPRSKFSTWLFTIANNLALNSLRSRQRKPVVSAALQRLRPARAAPRRAAGPRPPFRADAERLQQQELAAVIQQALDGLERTAARGGRAEQVRGHELSPRSPRSWG